MAADLALRSTTGTNAVPDLSHLNGFSPADVNANREGRLSAAQSRAARKEVLKAALATVALLVYVEVVAQGDGLQLALGWIIIAISAYRLIRDVQALRGCRVAHADGDAWVEIKPDSDGPDAYVIHVGGLKLETVKDVHATLRPGGPYRIYYLPTRRRAVGGELLAGWRSIPVPLEQKRSWLPLHIELG